MELNSLRIIICLRKFEVSVERIFIEKLAYTVQTELKNILEKYFKKTTYNLTLLPQTLSAMTVMKYFGFSNKMFKL